jgi:glutaredoxin
MLSKLKSFCRAFWSRKGSPHQAAPVRVEFYTREGCCLCDDALNALENARRRYLFDLDVIDVDRAADLQQKYGSLVPVILVNGRQRFHGRVNQVLLNRLLSVEATQS